MFDVSIIIVCMNRPDNLYPCLESIRRTTVRVSYEVLVVAYMYDPAGLAKAREDFPWVRFIESNEIRGFSENNNLALKQAKGRYCFILNDDTELPEGGIWEYTGIKVEDNEGTMKKVPGTIDRLVEDFEALPEGTAIVSPTLLNADGTLQLCGRPPYPARHYVLQQWHLFSEPKDSTAGQEPAAEVNGRKLFRSWNITGAAFLIPTDLFRELGWFDERFFFTPEDIALGHKLNDMGYTVWANPEVSVTHLAGGSVSALEQAIKPARVRGSMIFYGEPLWLKCFIWCFEALRAVKYFFLPRKGRNVIMRKSALNVMQAVFSSDTPKEIFKRFRP